MFKATGMPHIVDNGLLLSLWKDIASTCKDAVDMRLQRDERISVLI
jgi:hypothetical protein